MIEETYERLCYTPSDIHEHLPVIRQYASECESIVELGVRSIVSTWALLAGKPRIMLSVDITHPQEYGADINPVYEATQAADITWDFHKGSSLDIKLPETDLLFIDTDHTYEQLSQELALHSDKVKKYILMHDTNKAEFPGMNKALDEFLAAHKEWEVTYTTENLHGLTALKRI